MQHRENVIGPVKNILKVYENSALVVKRRRNCRLDYERSVELKLAGRKISSALAERANEYELLNDILKKELPMLSSLTRKLVRACLGNLVSIQAKWCETWKEQINKTVPYGFGSSELDKIVIAFHRDHDFVSEQVRSLGICNNTLMALAEASRDPSLGRTMSSQTHREHQPNRSSGVSGPEKAPELPWPTDVPRKGVEPFKTVRLERSETARPDGQKQANTPRFSGIFHSALPIADSDSDSDGAAKKKPSDTMKGSDDGYKVLFIAASLFEFNLSTTKLEAGYPYLTYQAGEIFDVIAEKGELWLAKNEDDPKEQIGWIWSKHFAKLALD
jgi:hypothetical protein